MRKYHIKCTISLLIFLYATLQSNICLGAPTRGEALVLVNSTSPSYSDFGGYIESYLVHFGIPYTILDIATAQVGPYVADYAVLIVGHKQLDPNRNYLDASEQATISSAVINGSGLVNFDNYLSGSGNTPLYDYIQTIFGFSYSGTTSASGITISSNFSTHYIVSRHQPGEYITTGSMTLAGIILPIGVNSLASSGTQPFIAVTEIGQGRAVQWGTYEWMKLAVKGPMYRLDDLVWRSIVWAAHKPFAIKGLPNFVTMRVDDVSGPLWWIEEANLFGLKPWLGLFINEIDNNESSYLSALVTDGRATASIHAFSDGNFFYYNHDSGSNLPDQVIADYFSQGAQWHAARNIPISKYLVPHYYEVGSNCFGGLANWGTEFIGTVMNPGRPYGDPWILGGPYRLYETPQSSSSVIPFYYSDFIPIPGSPYNGQFFNCIIEIRDDAGYEWHPSNDVSESIARGTRQLKRSLDSMALATLFTHEYYIKSIDPNNWHTILQGITNNLASYSPIFVTMDYACQYLRSLHTTSITSSTYDPLSHQMNIALAGQSDIPIQLHVFTENAGSILIDRINVQPYTGTTNVSYQVGATSELDHIVVTPISAELSIGESLQFTATGYDANGNYVSYLTFTWASSGGGNINQMGLFTATTPGNFINNISASSNGITGYASTTITAPETVSVPTIPSGPTSGTTGTSYSYTTGGSTSSLGHTVEYQFDWTGDGSSGPITINCWADGNQSPILQTTSNVATLNPTDGLWRSCPLICGNYLQGFVLPVLV